MNYSEQFKIIVKSTVRWDVNKIISCKCSAPAKSNKLIDVIYYRISFISFM